MQTAKLRALIEKRRKTRLWGQTYMVTPKLVAEIFGDGTQLLGLQPLNTRPNYYVVRIDSSWHTSNGDGPPNLHDHLDEIYAAIEAEFGSAECGYCGGHYGGDPETDCEGCKGSKWEEGAWPKLDDECGSSWFEMDWPKVKRGAAKQ